MSRFDKYASAASPDGRTIAYAGSTRTRGYDVTPDGSRFLMLTPVIQPGAAQTPVVINWAEETDEEGDPVDSHIDAVALGKSRSGAQYWTMTPADHVELGLLSRLSEHRSLGGAPEAELAWLATHGSSRSYAVGDVTTRKGQQEEWLQVVMSGHLAIRTDRGAGSRKIVEWRGGDVCGLMPYSRGGAPPGDTVAEAPTDTLAIHRDRMPDMIRDCPRVTAILVHAMLDRARHFTASDLHDEKLVSLGKLAAGLAHELNNPASAAARSAKLLMEKLNDAEVAARALEALRLTDAQRETFDQVRIACAQPAPIEVRGPIWRADREEEVTVWLESHDVDAALAAPLADANIGIESLDALADVLSTHALEAALQSIAAGCIVRALALDVAASVSRIDELVAAVKRFTYMDRGSTSEAIDLRPGIEDTFLVLGAKIKAKGIAVDLRVAPDLPQVRAFGGELNQVWSNLLDNALDAAPTSGRIDVTAERALDRVVVYVIDNGPGIPHDIQDRIFDPFFTTKPVGQGTGLGLDIVRRLVQRHDGEIDVESRPGRTVFRVSLPIAQ